jgi:hypothetical protein
MAAIDLRQVDATCSRHMATDSNKADDAEFFAWAKENDCSHEAMKRALDATAHVRQRPRLLRTEFWYAWIRALAFPRAFRSNAYWLQKPKPWGRLDARDRLGASDRAIGRALAPPPAAPPLTEERLRKIIVANLAIAERSGNRAAAELLHRQLKGLETRGR